jgi:chromosome segregation ATPase
MDKETKEFVEASFEKWSGILVGEFQRARENMAEMEDRINHRMDSVEDRLNHRMDGIKANLDSKIDTVRREITGLGLELEEIKPEVRETKMAVLRIEHALQDKQEAQGDELANQNQRLERIEDHLHLPHSLSAA